MVSRNVPPCAAVTTIIPAVGGPSRTTFHSSGEKAAFVVMPRSYVHLHSWGPIQHLTGCLRGRTPEGGAAGMAGRDGEPPGRRRCAGQAGRHYPWDYCAELSPPC